MFYSYVKLATTIVLFIKITYIWNCFKKAIITIENYYNILGIQKEDSLEIIKKAYRTKAKILHPDKNKSVDAHEQFILLNEAYEYLQNLKTGKLYVRNKKTYTTQKQTYEDWKKNEREKARARANKYAKMKYEEFVKSDYYESISSLSTIASHLSFFFGITIIVILPIFTTIFYGVAGFGIGLLINFILLPFTVTTIRNAPTLKLVAFTNAVLQIVKTKGFLITTLSIINIFILLKFGLQTLVSPLMLISTNFMAIVLVYLVTKSKGNKFKIYFYSFCITPLIISSFILINFFFSYNPTKETYAFQNDLQANSRGNQESTYIFLENNKYDEYPGVRIFLDYEEMRDKKHITYTFKEGILGLRVMTEYEFNP